MRIVLFLILIALSYFRYHDERNVFPRSPSLSENLLYCQRSGDGQETGDMTEISTEMDEKQDRVRPIYTFCLLFYNWRKELVYRTKIGFPAEKLFEQVPKKGKKKSPGSFSLALD